MVATFWQKIKQTCSMAAGWSSGLWWPLSTFQELMPILVFNMGYTRPNRHRCTVPLWDSHDCKQNHSSQQKGLHPCSSRASYNLPSSMCWSRHEMHVLGHSYNNCTDHSVVLPPSTAVPGRTSLRHGCHKQDNPTRCSGAHVSAGWLASGARSRVL